MNSSIFGPIAWTMLQSLPRLWNTKRPLSPELHESTAIIMYSIAVILPCRYCRESYRRYIQCIDIRRWLQEPKEPLRAEDVEYWLYLVHNLVNQKLERRWERNKDAVYNGRVREDERGYMDVLFDWLFILLMNYESLRPEEAAVLQRVGQYAYKNDGKLLRRATKHDVTLGALLDRHVFDHVYDKYVCRKGNVALTQQRWRKTCWYVFHIAHLVRALRDAPVLGNRAKQALALLEHYFVERAHETLGEQQKAFARLHEVRCRWDPSCPSYEQTVQRFESYRASA